MAYFNSLVKQYTVIKALCVMLSKGFQITWELYSLFNGHGFGRLLFVWNSKSRDLCGTYYKWYWLIWLDYIGCKYAYLLITIHIVTLPVSHSRYSNHTLDKTRKKKRRIFQVGERKENPIYHPKIGRENSMCASKVLFSIFGLECPLFSFLLLRELDLSLENSMN